MRRRRYDEVAVAERLISHVLNGYVVRETVGRRRRRSRQCGRIWAARCRYCYRWPVCTSIGRKIYRR